VPTEREFESFLRASGFSRRQAKGVVATGYKALRAEEDAVASLTEKIRAATAEIKSQASCDIDALTHRIRQATAETRLKYSSTQPRVPRGSSGGGRWTDGGGGSSGGTENSKPRDTVGTGRFKLPKPRGTLLQRVMLPDDDIPEKDPVDKLLEGGGGGRGGGRSFEGGWSRPKPTPAPREQEYLNEARKLPESVQKIGLGADKLTQSQTKKFEEWQKNNKNFQTDIEVTKFSDGRAIYTFRVPAADNTNSYKLYEKHVDLSGKTTDAYALTIRNGNLYENKNKMYPSKK
jgi:hypothetical protein